MAKKKNNSAKKAELTTEKDKDTQIKADDESEVHTELTGSAENNENSPAETEETLENAEGSEEAGEKSADGDAEAAEEDTSAKAMFAESLQGIVAFKNSVVDFLDKTGILEFSLVRFITAFFVISAVNIVMIKGNPEEVVPIHPVSAWKEFVPKVDGPITIGLMVAVFLFLTVIYTILPKKFRITDQCIAIFGVLYFDIVLLWRSGDFNLTFGVMMVSVVFIYYSVGKIKDHKLLNSIPWWVCGIIVVLSGAAVTTFVAITTCCTFKSFGTACHDFGLFLQMYQSLITDGTAVTSCERDTFMSHFKIHASYIFYVLVPIFKKYPYGETLMISQAVLALGGCVPMFLMAKRHKLKGLSLIFMGLSYVFCTGVVAPCYYEFHENAFLPTILMWLLWAVDEKKYIMFCIMSAITCIVKEDAPLYVICIGLFLFFEDKKSKKRFIALAMAAVSGIYMVWITNWLTENGDGQMMMGTRFGLLMIDTTAGLKEVVKNALSDPAYLFSLLVHEDTVKFFLQVMLPMLFIPFFTRKISRYLLMLPFVVMNLVIGAGYGYAANIGFQYIFGPACLLLYMCIINIEDMGQTGKQNVPVAMGAAAIIMTIGTVSPRWQNYIGYKNNQDYFTRLDAALDSIPKDAAVGTDTFLVSHLTDHKEVYIFDIYDYNDENVLFTPEKFDFVALPALTDTAERSIEVLTVNGYTLWGEVDDKIKIFKSPTYVE